MNIVQRITAKAFPSVEPYLQALITPGDTARTYRATNHTARELMALAGGLPMICAHVVAEAVSQCPMKLYKSGSVEIVERGRSKRVKSVKLEDMRLGRYGTKASSWAGSGGNVTEVIQHPVLDLLSRPNDVQTGTQAEYQAVLMSLITGEMFTVMVGRGAPEQLWPMLPQWCEPIVRDQIDTIIDGYAYGRDRSEVIEILAEDVLHYKHLENPRDPFHGYGPLHMCKVNAEVVLKNDAFDLAFVEDGNLPPLFVSLDPRVYSTDAKALDAQKKFREATRGISGKLRAFFASGMSVMAPPSNAKEMQTAEKLESHRAVIRQAFGVPESMLNMNDANLASSYTGNEQFWGGTVRPILWRRAEYLTEHLLPRFGLDPGDWFFAYEDPLLEDAEREMRIIEAKIRTGLYSRNEARADLNLDGVPGGETYYLNGVPLDEDGKPEQADTFGFGSFGSPSLPSPADDAEEPAVPAQKIEETALNGAQIAQLVSIAERVTTGVISRDAALAMAAASFPGIPEDKLRAIFGKLVEGSAVAPEGEPKPEGDVSVDDETKAMRVPVVGTLDAKGNDNAEAARLDRSGTEDEAGDGGMGRQVGVDVPAQGDPPILESGHGERDIRGSLLSAHHAGPDPYADAAPCGRCTKDDDDDRDLIVPAEFITAEQAARQTAALQAAKRTLSEIIGEFMDEARMDAVRQIRAGAAIDLTELQEQLAGNLEPAFRDLYRAGFDFAGLEIGEGADLDPFDIPNAEAIAETQTSLVRQFSKDVSDHTAQAIEGRVRAGLDEGQSIADIAKGIEEDTGFSEYRSERIARTEVSRATNHGKLARYKEAGITTKYSVTAPGASAVHRAIEARASDGVGMDEPFVRAGEVITGADGTQEKYDRDYQAPPYRPFCRCSIQTRKNDRPTEDEA